MQRSPTGGGDEVAMPRLIIRQNRRSLVAAFDNFEREYPARVIGRVMRPWAKLVVQSVKRQGPNPKTGAHDAE